MRRYHLSAVLLILGALLPGGSVLADRSILFSMPEKLPLDSELLNPLASKHPIPVAEGRFAAVIWEPNPFHPDGRLVSSTWPVGEKTGLNGVSGNQYGYSDLPNSTTVQYSDGAFGAFLNSADLQPNKPYHKLMIAPFYRWGIQRAIDPFEPGSKGIHAVFKLQVPTATDSRRKGSAAYILVDFEFIDEGTGDKISYGCSVFFNGAAAWPGEIGFDLPSKSWMINSPVKASSNALRVDPDSAQFASEPWRGWKTFAFLIDPESFATQLRRLQAARPLAKVSTDPSSYRLSQVHVNAELNFASGPSTLGWSIRDFSVSVDN